MEGVIKVLSANCQGLRDKTKRADVINYLEGLGGNIICLQETHWVNKDIGSVKNIWKGECFINGFKTNSRGVAVLIKPNFEYKIRETIANKEGNLLILDIILNDISVRLINVYAPNIDSPNYYLEVERYIKTAETNYVILCGDLNLTLNPNMDCVNYKHLNNPCARNKLLEIIDNHKLKDAFRVLNPLAKRYTWRRKKPLKQARLDYYLVSDNMIDIIKNCNIKPGYRSDHSIIELNIVLCKFKQGKGVWKFNCSLLKNKEYLLKINKAIEEEQERYAISNIDKGGTPSSDSSEQAIGDGLFLETLLLRLRGETIKFSTIQKQKNNLKENELINNIAKLEQENQLGTELESAKAQLETLREEKMNGIRTRNLPQSDWYPQTET